jgi:hypothetical protein
MRLSLCSLIFFGFVAGSKCVFAQATNAAAPPPPPSAREMAALSFLTPAQQEQYAKARAKALTDNPDLKAEGDQILREGQDATTPVQVQDFHEKMISHRQKLRAAMLKVDPTLGVVFAAIDNHISQMKSQQATSTSAGGGSNSH